IPGFAMGEEKKGITGALSRHLKGMTRSTVESLAKKFGVMPSDRAWVAVDVGASLASVSLSVTSEFFKAAPEVAQYLENDDLRAWAELGRRIALNNPEEAVEFFGTSAKTLAAVPERLRPLLVALCGKQIVLSPAAALATFHDAPRTVTTLADENAEVEKTDDGKSPTEYTLGLAESFAQRTGATAAEFLTTVGEGLKFIRARQEIADLCAQTLTFLERGGATALQYFRSARAVLEHGGTNSFAKWGHVTRRVADEGNALVYDFLKLTPKILAALASQQRRQAGQGQQRNSTASERINTVLNVVEKLTAGSVYSALECFKSAPRALAVASLEQFQVWAEDGAQLHRQDR